LQQTKGRKAFKIFECGTLNFFRTKKSSVVRLTLFSNKKKSSVARLTLFSNKKIECDTLNFFQTLKNISKHFEHFKKFECRVLNFFSNNPKQFFKKLIWRRAIFFEHFKTFRTFQKIRMWGAKRFFRTHQEDALHT
jgi:hypothetical protein